MLRSHPAFGNRILIFVGIGSLVFGHLSLHSVLNAGLSPHVFSDGTNLLRQAAIVKIVEKGMKKIYPEIHQPMMFLFEDIDVWAFCRDKGPRFWYDTDQIQIDTLASVKCDGQGLYVEHQLAQKESGYTNSLIRKEYLDPKATAAFRLNAGVLQQISSEELKKTIRR